LDIPGPSGRVAWTITTQEVIAMVGRKWVVPVVRELEAGTRRQFQLRNGIRGVTPKVLTDTLRSLERDGVIERVLHDDGRGSKSVAYRLTDLGRSLSVPVNAIYRWGRDHLDEVHRCRRDTDTMWAGGTTPPGARGNVEVPKNPLK
jgi:DNA-binding HxlR family transcriptional regulator